MNSCKKRNMFLLQLFSDFGLNALEDHDTINSKANKLSYNIKLYQAPKWDMTIWNHNYC
jgi:hypothetical protein